MRLTLLLPLILLAACARQVAVAPPALPVDGAEEVGYASWYGHPYHGRRTASGEVYDMNDLTAAHRTLPFGTWVLVTNLDTGKALDLRINDRGPFVDGRILDLSYAAARLLDAVGPGVIPVRLRVTAPPGRTAGGPGPLPPAAFTVQVGAFATRERAESLRAALERDGERPAISRVDVGGVAFYRVRVGAFPDRETARALALRLASRGYQSIIVER